MTSQATHSCPAFPCPICGFGAPQDSRWLKTAFMPARYEHITYDPVTCAKLPTYEAANVTFVGPPSPTVVVLMVDDQLHDAVSFKTREEAKAFREGFRRAVRIGAGRARAFLMPEDEDLIAEYGILLLEKARKAAERAIRECA